MHDMATIWAASVLQDGIYRHFSAFTVVVGGWQAMGLVWLLTAIWFAAWWPGSVGKKLWHFVVTLFPEPWLLVVLPVVAVLVNLLPASVWAHVTWRQSWLSAVGAALVAVSAVLMIWARLALGRMWAGRPMVQEHHELRTGGPYALVRHPIYTGLLGMILGTAIATGFGSFIVIVACTLAWLLWRVHVEDGMMTRTFGDEFRAYQRQVPALLPLPRPSGSHRGVPA